MGGTAVYALMIGLLAVFLIFGIRLAQAIYPWVVVICGLSLLIVGPIALACAFIPRTRSFSAAALYYVSMPLFWATWLASFIYSFQVTRLFCTISVFFGGFGVIPLTFILTIFRRDWPALLSLIENLGCFLLVRVISIAIMQWHATTESKTMAAANIDI
jgi:hypothetical protein